MELLTFAIAAGETKRFERAGRYFEIIEATAAISVFFDGEAGSRQDDMIGALSGFFASGPFKSFAISSVTAQSVTVMYAEGSGGSRRQPGIVQVVNAVGSNCAVTGLALVTLGAINVGAIVLPAANVRGLIVHGCYLSALAGAGGRASVRIVAGLTAPSTYLLPYANSVILGAVQSTGSSDPRANDIPITVTRRIPPGWGLWVVTEILVIDASAASGTVNYELL